MTGTVQEQIKTDWQKAQAQGGQRATRIRKILSTAATEAFGEIKAGSQDLQVLSRQALATMVAQMKQGETAVPSAGAADATAIATAETPTPADAAAPPTWREIVRELFGVVNRRKGDWSAQALNRLQAQIGAWDREMTQTYGDRYRPISQRMVRLQAWLKMAAARVTKADQGAAVPVQIEVLDAEDEFHPGAFQR